MNLSLAQWEKRFEELIGPGLARPQDSGAWLPLVPCHDDWEEFLVAVRTEWPCWLWDIGQHELCFLMLYEGVAFFFYEGGAFWEAFGMATTGVKAPPSPSKQSAINQQFERICGKYNLPVHRGPAHTSFVGSAVYHVGIPIHVWSGFVAVCEWAWYCANWETMTDENWKQRIRVLVPPRLHKFLCDNRATAAKWIKEMHDVRRILDENPTQGLSDIKQASFLRTEYFDEVPETADFLRERDPDSLFRDRPRLMWSIQTDEISVQLPRVDKINLPASWRFKELSWRADTNPTAGRHLNSRAFVPSLSFELETAPGSQSKRVRISGLGDWALYDAIRERFVNATRDVLPLSRYSLLSLQPLNLSEKKGWIEHSDEPRENVECRFSEKNGSQYFVTDLVPDEKNEASLCVNGRRLKFRRRRKVNLRIFSARESHRFRYGFDDARVLTCEEWPRLVLEVPRDYYNEEALAQEFQVYVDGQRVDGGGGGWRDADSSKDEDESVFYFWKWPDGPIGRPAAQSTVLRDLSALNATTIAQPPATPQEHEIWVQSPRIGRIPFGPRASQRIRIILRRGENWWPTHPRDYLVWVLLSEVQDEATWEEIRIAHNEIAAFQTIPTFAMLYYQLRKIEQAEMAMRKGRLWTEFKNRILFDRPQGGRLQARYAGLTTSLYVVLRAISPVEKINIPRAERGRPPHLEVVWASRDHDRLRQKCLEAGIGIMKESLWTH